MPGVAALKACAEERDPDEPLVKAEDVKLWMPSELTTAQRQRRGVCRKAVAEVEAKLRVGQCKDALDELRSWLHAQRHLVMWRNANFVGQRAATRSATLIGRVGDRIRRTAAKYWRAREAVIALKGDNFAPHFKELNQENMNANEEEESDAKSRKKLSRLGGKCSPNKPSNKKRTFSWIWMVGGGPGEDEATLHDSVQVEWSKALARRDRWVEEVELLREEMKRVLRMLRTIQEEWRERTQVCTQDMDIALAGGLKAYALHQVDQYGT
ncbi:hypothetical protein B0H17DRAFT_1211183 [Mycena rosella]|uniref:Uncharacterized protein n=1 Tax=Mycena rosella TaxID=1033263 RepID=A0AAD7CUW3_MYCRO|nr:hypothetical protein B0H17DRAFT_1211183 [Mycena rosella]